MFAGQLPVPRKAAFIPAENPLEIVAWLCYLCLSVLLGTQREISEFLQVFSGDFDIGVGATRIQPAQPSLQARHTASCHARGSGGSSCWRLKTGPV